MRWRAEPKAERPSVKSDHNRRTHREGTEAREVRSQRFIRKPVRYYWRRMNLDRNTCSSYPSRGQLHCVPLQHRAVVAIAANSPAQEPRRERVTSPRHNNPLGGGGVAQTHMRHHHVNTGRDCPNNCNLLDTMLWKHISGRENKKHFSWDNEKSACWVIIRR